MSYDNRPIGLFDSGIGGLTVLKALHAKFPNESFVYLGDTARLPYGSKSPTTIERYLWQNVQFLETRSVKGIVVACNSASTVLLGKTSDHNIPLYNVIEPGAKLAIQSSESGRIGVLGTRATVSAQAYVTAIHKISPQTQVWQQACPLLVPLVEEGWDEDPITNLVVYRYLAPLVQQQVDTVILGCTHYPALRTAIAKVVGNHVKLVESSEAIAQQISADFQASRIKPAAPTNQGTLALLTTDVSANFQEVATRLMHPHRAPPLEAVDLTPDLTPNSRQTS